MPLPLLPVDKLWQQMEARGVHTKNMIFDYEYGIERSVALSRRERPLPSEWAVERQRLDRTGRRAGALESRELARWTGQVKQKSCLCSRARRLTHDTELVMLTRTTASTQRSARSARNQSLSDVEPAPRFRAKAQPSYAHTWVVKGEFPA